jgi:ubiquinone biosynthesis protein COQ4
MGYENLQPALERFKMTAGFIAGGGRNTETVFDLEDSFHDSPQMAACVERMKGDPEMGRLIAQGYTTPDFDLEELIRYPPGTLAHTYAKLPKTQGLTAHFYHDRPVKADAAYCIMRVRKTHDLHHVVTGFGMVGGGELGVIAVTAYQYGYPAFATIDLTAVALAFHQAQGFQQAIDFVGVGVQIARACKPLMGTRWEDGRDKPVDRWRVELGIKPITSGPYSWYTSVPAASELTTLGPPPVWERIRARRANEGRSGDD